MMKNYYEFTDHITNKVMDELLTMERDVCNALKNCKDIRDGLFKVGTYMGKTRSEIYDILRAEQTKSDDAKYARTCEADKGEEE